MKRKGALSRMCEGCGGVHIRADDVKIFWIDSDGAHETMWLPFAIATMRVDNLCCSNEVHSIRTMLRQEVCPVCGGSGRVSHHG